MAEPFTDLHAARSSRSPRRTSTPTRSSRRATSRSPTRTGLADALFRDWRFEEDGSLKEPRFVLDQPGMAGRQILLVGDNFGAGSSREHAPWALTAWGVRAIISTSYADIFRSNSLKNGVLPIVVDPATHARLFATCVAAGPGRGADGRPGRAGRPAARTARRSTSTSTRSPSAMMLAGHRRARLPPLEGARDRRVGGGPPAADRFARREAGAESGARRHHARCSSS